jgi:hypothetical protein
VRRRQKDYAGASFQLMFLSGALERFRRVLDPINDLLSFSIGTKLTIVYWPRAALHLNAPSKYTSWPIKYLCIVGRETVGNSVPSLSNVL